MNNLHSSATIHLMHMRSKSTDCWPLLLMVSAGHPCGLISRAMIRMVTKRITCVWAFGPIVIGLSTRSNRNLPYDQFVTKQVAGDLLPNATFEDRIATSFHRQTPNNLEGGTDDEEFRLVAVMGSCSNNMVRAERTDHELCGVPLASL